VRSFLAPWPGS